MSSDRNFEGTWRPHHLWKHRALPNPMTQHHITGDFSLVVGTNLPALQNILQWKWRQQISPK